MNKTYLIAIAAALVAAPLAFAHTDGMPNGTPKRYCEDFKSERMWHDYGPSTGSVIFLPMDGSNDPCAYGSHDPADFTGDGHYEYAFGGAWLVSGYDAAAAAACGWPYPDHPPHPVVTVWDDVLTGQLAADVAFSVYADTQNLVTPDDPGCGDFESDFGVDCLNLCEIDFPPGLDQTYQVYVNGFFGHVWTNGF